MPVKEFYPKDRKAWRNWLQKNHDKEQSVWLIVYKKGSGVPSITMAEAVEEALCFGWIDSKANKRDDKSFKIIIAQRKAKSGWSAINKQRVAKLIREGLMTDAGMVKINEAKKSGAWTMLDAVEAMKMPAELEKAFKKSKTALKNFEAFPPSTRKAIFQWIEAAKLPETKKKRVTETVTLAARNERANQWKRK